MIIKLKPVFFEKVWGGNTLHKLYNYNCNNSTGEAWGISAHNNGSSIVSNGPYKDMTLKELYATHRELFGNCKKIDFPILIKLIDAHDDLSIQVHPDNVYAQKYEHSMGKTECWYILEAAKKTQMIIGHKMNSKTKFIQEMKQNNWDSILNKFPIHSGERYCVPSGTIHAICKGTLLLEIQQSSDITYRLYDYLRPYNGKMRELHVNKALDVINFPDRDVNHSIPKHLFDFKIINILKPTLRHGHVHGDYIFILEGIGYFNETPVKKGDFVFVTSKTKYQASGSLSYFYSTIK